jgi:hypothetical protein
MKRPLLAALLFFAANAYADIPQALHQINSLKPEGRGNEKATTAWQELVQAGPEALLPILSATGKGGVVADNWLRLAANTIADHAAKQKKPLPLQELEKFLRDTTHDPAGRQIAFDLIHASDPAKADEIEPELLNDPSQELRRGAVQKLISEGKTAVGKKDEVNAKLILHRALDASRDEDQVKVIASSLEGLGEKVDLPKHFGFLMNWQVIGPFDNTKRSGFDTVFPPEKEIKLSASYPGKTGEVKWQPFESKQDYGKIDFNKPFGMLKEVTAYATTTFDSPTERDAEIRLGCKDGWKLWLNGEFLFGRDEYHRGQKMDQYKLKCHLKKGPNVLLMKCCQNEQTENWTVEWEFQLRICDATGTAILASAK